VFELTRRALAAILVCGGVVLSGCALQQQPEVKILSDEEAAELWESAEGFEPVGKPVTRQFPGTTGTITTTSQVYLLRMPGGRLGTSVVTVCGGSCLLKPGGTFGGCVTSGCMPSGNSCTPLVCSGTCELSSACTAQSSIGIFAQ
jgi:hypothetical protein